LFGSFEKPDLSHQRTSVRQLHVAWDGVLQRVITNQLLIKEFCFIYFGIGFIRRKTCKERENGIKYSTMKEKRKM
jgi:hypothetical protein